MRELVNSFWVGAVVVDLRGCDDQVVLAELGEGPLTPYPAALD